MKKSVQQFSLKTKKLPSSVVYVRTSTKTNQHKSGVKRGRHAALAAASARRDKVTDVFHEIVSGCAPLEKRKVITDLIERLGSQSTPKKVGQKKPVIYCESARDVARDMTIGEALYNMSTALDVQIFPSDTPDLFKHNPNANDKWMRRVLLATAEFEKDRLVHRFQSGLGAARQTSEKKTQEGGVKVNGRKSKLEELYPKGHMPKDTRVYLSKAFEKQKKGELSWRGVQQKLQNKLKLDSLTVECVRRVSREFLNNW